MLYYKGFTLILIKRSYVVAIVLWELSLEFS